MSKRKFSVINYIESEECSSTKGHKDGEAIAKLLKKEPTFNFKSYLDGLCNGYTIEFKLLKCPTDISPTNFCFETKPLVESINLLTYINHEKASYNKGNRDGINLAKNNDVEFINFKSYLDGLCDGYTKYENTISHCPFNFFNFNFGSSDCVVRADSLPQPSLQITENILDVSYINTNQ